MVRVSFRSAQEQNRALTGRALAIMAALGSACIVTSVHAAPKGAQPSSKAPSTDSDRAIQLAREGASKFDKHDFDGAAEAYSKAYELAPAPDLLLSLAIAQINAGRVIEGIENLRLVALDPETPADKAAMVTGRALPALYEKGLRVDVGLPSGTIVEVDGVPVRPRISESDPLVLMPGHHVLKVPADGREGAVEGKAGDLLQVRLLHTTAPPKSISSDSPPPKLISAAPTTLSSASSPSSPSARTIVLIAGSALTVAGVVTGLVFLDKVSSDNDRFDRWRNSITGPQSQYACSAPELTGFVTECAELRRADQDRIADSKVAAGSFIVGGVAAAATIGTWLLWPSSKKPVVMPTATPSSFGLTVAGAL